MGVDSPQRKGKRAKLLYVAVFHCMAESFRCGLPSQIAPGIAYIGLSPKRGQHHLVVS